MNLLRLVLVTTLLAPLSHAASKATFTRGETKFDLSHVTAVRFTPKSGPSKVHLLFAAKPAEGVILTDAFGDPGFSLLKWAQSSATPAIKVEFNEGAIESFSFNSFNIEGGDIALGGHQESATVRGPFKDLDLTADRISGTLSYQAPNGVLAGTFDAPIQTIKEPSPISGAAVGKSAQAQALLSFVRALHKFDFGAAEKHSANPIAEELKAERKRRGDKAMKDLFNEEFGDPKALEKLLSAPDAQLAAAEESAKIWIKKPGNDQLSRFGLFKIDGKWKVNW